MNLGPRWWNRRLNSRRVVKTSAVVGLSLLLLFQLTRGASPAPDSIDDSNLAVGEIRPGETLTDVALIDLRAMGAAETVSLPSLVSAGCHYLMIIAAECPWCERIAPTWSGATQVHFDGASYPMTWISVGPDNIAARDYITSHDLKFPAFAVASAEDSRRLRWIKVPSLWLLRGDTVVSTVEPVQHGELEPPRVGDCEHPASKPAVPPNG